MESDYLRGRAHDEEQAAQASTHPEARRAHRELAARYAALADEVEADNSRQEIGEQDTATLDR